MNRELRTKLGVEAAQVVGYQLEDLLTVGSKIFYQTHFYPLIKMQHSVREIYLVFKGINGHIPALLNVEVKQHNDVVEILCGGMEISKRHKFEKELIDAKIAAEVALAENAELTKAKNKLQEQQTILELKYREVKLLKEQEQEIYKLISHDLQEPLRKSIFMSNYVLTKNSELPEVIKERLNKIIKYNTDMSEMLLTLLRYKELKRIKLNHNSLQLNDIIKNAAKSLQMDDQKQIVIEYPIKNIEFPGDEKMLRRLFIELLRNSIKEQNPENDKLTIEITAVKTIKNYYFNNTEKYRYKNFVKITYKDNGLGLNYKLDKIIQKTAHFNKVNIGLAYCKQIVEKHLGAMEAASVRGKGVSYTILFPCDPVTEEL
ncbi:Phosphoserine phosphatase RsbP [Kordia antarctica]|uniref:histidine kinase n=2 Tax=Kordia antarctica TaxID=1218801 RepID=A0A7L4ZEL6_9FLAO|nr:HAMP domain-containing sensor histidine kinase [Kordia antarctica]QHI35133.1 Phosphoserine phosphatase RsbP [Kordia antarctica]